MLRPITDVLRRLKSGTLIDDASTKMAELVKKVEETGKPAKLTITLTVKPASKAQGAVVISDKVKATLPELPAGETILFVTPECNLVANDPRQKEIDLKAVSAATTEAAQLKTVNG